MMISMGHGNSVNRSEIVTIVNTDSAPFKKLRRSAQAERLLINATGSHKKQPCHSERTSDNNLKRTVK